MINLSNLNNLDKIIFIIYRRLSENIHSADNSTEAVDVGSRPP